MSNCKNCSKKAIFSIAESKSSFVLKNTNHKYVCEVKVDGCLITTKQRKCDFLFEVYTDKPDIIEELIYVELKGSNLEHGAKQILETDMALHAIYSQKKISSKKAFIITSRSPLSSKELRVLKTDFWKKYKIVLDIKNRSYEHSV